MWLTNILFYVPACPAQLNQSLIRRDSYYVAIEFFSGGHAQITPPAN